MDEEGKFGVDKTSIGNKKSNLCCKVFAIQLVCLMFLLFGGYVIYDLRTTKLKVSSLELELEELKSLVLKELASKQMNPELKRSVRSNQRQFSYPTRDRVEFAPAAQSTSPTSFWHALRGSSSSTTPSTTTQARYSPQSAFPRSQSGELPVEAYPSSNLVITPDEDVQSRLASSGGSPQNRNSQGAPGAPDTVGQAGFDGAPGTTGRTSEGTASTFVRWGNVRCPQASTYVYGGYAAAANPWYGMGGSTELQCLSISPTWHSNATTTVQTTTKLFAAKFDIGSHTGVFDAAADNSVITCAVCLTTKPTVITMPGRIDCPDGWHREYHGYMMATSAFQYQMYFSSRNYCVDKNPSYYTGHNDSNGLKLTFVQAGSCYNNKYPCIEYTENKRLACTVCSKYPLSY